MPWPFKTTISFRGNASLRTTYVYAVSAADMIDAKTEIERRFRDQELSGFTIERIEAATQQEASTYNLPAGCVQLLGY